MEWILRVPPLNCHHLESEDNAIAGIPNTSEVAFPRAAGKTQTGQ